MSVKILVANKCNVSTSEIIAVVGGTHKFSKNETMQEWINSGEDSGLWKRHFSLVIVEDKELSEIEYLLDPLIKDIDGETTNVGNKYHFSQPNNQSPLYLSLLNTGEVSATWDIVSSYLRERS